MRSWLAPLVSDHLIGYWVWDLLCGTVLSEVLLKVPLRVDEVHDDGVVHLRRIITLWSHDSWMHIWSLDSRMVIDHMTDGQIIPITRQLSTQLITTDKYWSHDQSCDSHTHQVIILIIAGPYTVVHSISLCNLLYLLRGTSEAKKFWVELLQGRAGEERGGREGGRVEGE